MTVRIWWLALALAIVALVPSLLTSPGTACCSTGPPGKPVVNADQTVVIIWDAASKTQHFIRQASFKSDADDFGFLVPTPTEPELAESGNDAFPLLLKLTEPEKQEVWFLADALKSCYCCNIGCSSSTTKGVTPTVKVLQEKLVAGFKAVVLEAGSEQALVSWLRDNGYAFSPEVEAWAKPYIAAKWKVTALKVAKDSEGKADKSVTASALRLSFKTDRPVFPYREPDSRSYAAALSAKQRLLRIYFLAEVRYQGELTQDSPWTGKVAWADKVSSGDRQKLLEILKLPENTGPAEWWLTEFEDEWPYRVAPADVYFFRDANQFPMKRPPNIEYVILPMPCYIVLYVLFAATFIGLLLLWRWFRANRKPQNRTT